MKFSNPSFCFIAPTSILNQTAVASNTHLVLAHLLEQDDKYVSFYKKMNERGDFIICDNGAFELGESYAPDRLIALASKCGANAIVLPDYPGRPSNVTIDAAIEWAPKFREAGFLTMFVPQSEVGDTEGWIGSYQWAAESDLVDIIGMSILGIPNALPTVPKAWARAAMTQKLYDRGIFAHDKHHHYLGLNAGPSVELPTLILMGALDTCDSSNPVWCGVNSVSYDVNNYDVMGVRKKLLPEVDFNYTNVSEQQLGMIRHNVEVTQHIFTNPTTYL